MPYYHSEGIKLFYQDEGRGTPVVFLHGFTVDSRMWQTQSHFFSKSFRVIIPDARGHGKSEAPETGYSRDHRVEDVKNLLNELNIDNAHIVGLSMGGSTAIGFALTFPERLKSLVLVSTGAAGYNVSKKIPVIDEIAKLDGVETARKKWMNWTLGWYKDRFQEIGSLLKTMMLEHSGAIWVDPMRGKYPRTNDLENAHKINLPTLIMAGELDRVFVPLAEELHEKIRGSKFVVFNETGHMLNLEQPEPFNERLEKFLKSVDENASSTL